MADHHQITTAREAGDERCGRERRKQSRRAPQRPFDPLFAATLVNQIAPEETRYVRGYAPGPGPRPGIAINIRA